VLAAALVMASAGCGRGQVQGFSVSFLSRPACYISGTDVATVVTATIDLVLVDNRADTRPPISTTVTVVAAGTTPGAPLVHPTGPPAFQLHSGINPVSITFAPGLGFNRAREIYIVTATVPAVSGQPETTLSPQLDMNAYAGLLGASAVAGASPIGLCRLHLITTAHPRPTRPIEFQMAVTASPERAADNDPIQLAVTLTNRGWSWTYGIIVVARRTDGNGTFYSLSRDYPEDQHSDGTWTEIIPGLAWDESITLSITLPAVPLLSFCQGL
jgi:hypothetical protein